MVRSFVVGICVATCLAWGADIARAQSQPGVTLVIDYSASMWGQIDGKNKVVIVHDGIRSVLKPKIGEIGFSAIGFGASKKSSCSDTPVLASPGPLSQDQLDGVFARRPKGSPALSEAIKTGASLTSTGKRAMIVIADGPDGCKKDPCAEAAQLKASQPGLQVHMIALSKQMSPQTLALKCISEPSGGTFHAATNEVEFVAALSTAMKLIQAPPAPRIAATPEKAPSAPLAAMPGASFADDIATKSGNQTGGYPGQRGWVGQPPPTVAPPQNSFETQTTLAVRVPDPSPVDEARVRLVPFVEEGGSELRKPVMWRVYKQESGKPKPKLVAKKRGTRTDFVLEPGTYYVNAAFGQAQQTQKIVVAAGEQKDIPVILNAGGLLVEAVTADGTPVPARQVRYKVLSDERDQFGRRSTIISGGKVGQTVRLNAGLYHLISKVGDANAMIESDFVIEPGRLTKVTVRHTSVTATFKLVLQDGGEALADTQWLVQTADGETVKEVVGALPTLVLALGDYKVTAKRAGLVFREQFTLDEPGRRDVQVVASSRQFTAPRPQLAIPGITIEAPPEVR